MPESKGLLRLPRRPKLLRLPKLSGKLCSWLFSNNILLGNQPNKTDTQDSISLNSH